MSYRTRAFQKREVPGHLRLDQVSAQADGEQDLPPFNSDTPAHARLRPGGSSRARVPSQFILQ